MIYNTSYIKAVFISLFIKQITNIDHLHFPFDIEIFNLIKLFRNSKFLLKGIHNLMTSCNKSSQNCVKELE